PPGTPAQADTCYRKPPPIPEDPGAPPGMAPTYAQFGLLAEARAQEAAALEWNIRAIALFDESPSRLTGTAPTALVRLTRLLGMPALEAAWPQVTGHPLPQAVRDYVTSHHHDPPAAP